MATKATAQIDIVDLTDGVGVILSSESFVVVGDKSGAATAASNAFSVSVTATRGDSTIPCTVTVTPPTGITAGTQTVSSNVVTIPFSVAATLVDRGTITLSIAITGTNLVFSKAIDVAVARTGADGAASKNYFLNAAVGAIIRAENGTLSSTSITWNSTSATTGTAANYKGYTWSHYTTDGSTWTQITKATTSAYIGTVTIPSNVYTTIKAVRITLHTASPTDANKVDSVTIPVIDEGATGPQGDQGEGGYTVLLTNDSHTFAADASGKALASSTTARVVAYKGTTQQSATIGTITGQVTGLTTSVSNNSTANATITISAATTLETTQGVLTIPITVDDVSFTKQFSWSLAIKGEQGIQGEKGDDAIVIVIESSAGLIFKNTSAATTLTAHIFQGGTELTSSQIASLGTVKWYQDGGSTPVGTGLTYGISAGDVTSHASFTATLED